MKKILFLIFLFGVSFQAHAYNTFHPEADEELKQGKMWAIVEFEKKSTATKCSFRTWLDFPANKLWHALIDINGWKIIHDDYKDSRSLDKNQFELINEKKPTHIQAFYELVGEEIFPSELYRVPGKIWESYAFQRFAFPFPLKDRWVVMKVKNNENNAPKNEYRYDYEMTVGNFKALKGYWELLPVPENPGWIEFRGEYKADPGISVPHFLTRSIFKSSMKNNVQDIVKVLEAQGQQK